METTDIQAKLPTRLWAEMQTLVREGWFEDINDVIVSALRRYIETHRPELTERHIREDVEWGLYGQE